ncbi:MAG: hypothetical protein RL030_2169 [Pseudomonadota bacterium]
MTIITHLFLDFENVEPPAKDIELVRGADMHLWIFRGPHQNKFDATLAQAWQPLGSQVHFVQSSKVGKNALDFHIAFCMGEAHRQDQYQRQKALYIVVSRDKGFDALFGYVRNLGSAIGRANSIPEALKLAASLSSQATTRSPQAVKAKNTPTQIVKQSPRPAAKSVATKLAIRATMAPGDVDKVVEDLRARPTHRPTDRKALEHQIISHLGHKVTGEVALQVIGKLERQGIVKFDGKKAVYQMPKGKRAGASAS